MTRELLLLLGVIAMLAGCCPATPVPAEPWPVYLSAIRPAPGKSYTVEEYEDLALSYVGGEARVPGICFTVYPASLVEPGDFLTAEQFLGRVSLVVDGQTKRFHHSLFKTDYPAVPISDPETSQVIAQIPEGSPLSVCYAASLGAGVHTATVAISRTSGVEETYTWQFIITP